MTSPVLLCALLGCLALTGMVAAIAVKSGSAYTGVTVAIHKDIERSDALIQSIKDQFTKASRVLYDSTGGWAYYKEVIIAVPSSWPTTGFSNVYSDPYQTAEFRIDNPNGAYGNRPYTLQPGGCGEPGTYVHFTPQFLTDKSVVEDYGPIDRLIAHEWAHLRYGIFDEYGTPGDIKFPLFYFDDGFMKVSVCSEDIEGDLESDDGPICSVYNDRVTRDCVFIPNMKDASTRSSIMSLPYMPSVDRFCTKDNNTGTGHNWRAPTPQNLICNRRSAWEIISGHPDFAANKNTGEVFAAPIFRLVRHEPLPQRFVFIMDVSGSMSGQPLVLMKRSVDGFLTDMVKDDSYVGLVTFQSAAAQLHPLTRINGAARGIVRGRVASMQAGGGTSIGTGILAGIQNLKSGGQPTEDAILIVVTDGEEEQNSITIAKAMPAVLSAKIKVWCVAFGGRASLDLERIAVETGGRSMLVQNIQGTSTADLDQFFVGATTVQADINVQMIQLVNKPFSLNQALTETTVTMDAELGKNAIFTLGGQVDQVDFDLESPSGKKFVASSSEFKREPGKMQYKMSDAEKGVWKITMRRKTAATVTVDFGLVSEQRNPKEQPIRVNAWINAEKVKYPAPLKVFAQVTKGSDVIIRAEVLAVVTSDRGDKVQLTLKDDGSGADTLPDDGIYAGFFTQYTAGAKRYTVSAEISNRGKAFIKSAKHSASPVIARRKPRVAPKTPPSKHFKLDRFQILEEDPESGIPVGDPAGNFDRTTQGGSFIVDNFDQNTKDLIKPNAVNDLRVLGTGETKDGRKYVILTWTAPGDNMDVGTPSTLELRVSLNGDNFIKNFATGRLLDRTHVVNGTLTPQAGGTKQVTTVFLPDDLLADIPTKKSLDVYLSLKATDKAGNVGDLGNIAAAHFGYDMPICLTKIGLFPKARSCNQFYHCSNGEPHLMNCPDGLHYSPQSTRCEWPCSAKCDPKIKCAPN